MKALYINRVAIFGNSQDPHARTNLRVDLFDTARVGVPGQDISSFFSWYNAEKQGTPAKQLYQEYINSGKESQLDILKHKFIVLYKLYQRVKGTGAFEMDVGESVTLSVGKCQECPWSEHFSYTWDALEVKVGEKQEASAPKPQAKPRPTDCFEAAFGSGSDNDIDEVLEESDVL